MFGVRELKFQQVIALSELSVYKTVW